VQSEYAAYEACLAQAAGGKIAGKISASAFEKGCEAPEPPPHGEAPKQPEVGPAEVANAAGSGFVEAAEDCFGEHLLAGLDRRFNDLDVGRASTGPTWAESIMDLLSKISVGGH
jgi:hypothetical protein